VERSAGLNKFGLSTGPHFDSGRNPVNSNQYKFEQIEFQSLAEAKDSGTPWHLKPVKGLDYAHWKLEENEDGSQMGFSHIN